MERLDEDALSAIVLFTGQEHWPMVSLVSRSYNKLLTDTLSPLLDRLARRCSRVEGLEKCILSESVVKFYVRASWRTHRRYNRRTRELLS